MGRKFVKIGGYSDQLLIPVSLLEKILESGYLARTSWDSELNCEKLSMVSAIEKVDLIDEDEIKTVLAQQLLQGK